MIHPEALKKIKQLEITTKRLLSGTLIGDDRSAIKGSGLEFDQIREYQLGDDIRFIDWNSSARTNKVLVKQYIEERNRTILLAVDISRSQSYASSDHIKRDVLANIAGAIALVADYGKDNVGLILFSDKIELCIAPGKGKKHTKLILEALFSYEPKQGLTDINVSLAHAASLKRKDTLLFLISDFIADNFEQRLGSIIKKYDVVAIRCLDKNEIQFPQVGFLTIEDFETGESLLVDTRKKKSASINQFLESRINNQNKMFKKYGIDSLTLANDKHFMGNLIRFFARRMRY
jgi:uncharacterized protein (DUF58 family)